MCIKKIYIYNIYLHKCIYIMYLMLCINIEVDIQRAVHTANFHSFQGPRPPQNSQIHYCCDVGGVVWRPLMRPHDGGPEWGPHDAERLTGCVFGRCTNSSHRVKKILFCEKNKFKKIVRLQKTRLNWSLQSPKTGNFLNFFPR